MCWACYGGVFLLFGLGLVSIRLGYQIGLYYDRIGYDRIGYGMVWNTTRTKLGEMVSMLV